MTNLNDFGGNPDRLTIAAAADKRAYPWKQDRLTYAAVPCPHCDRPTLGILCAACGKYL